MKWYEQRKEVRDAGRYIVTAHARGDEIPYSFYQVLPERFTAEERIAIECYAAYNMFCIGNAEGMTAEEMDAKVEEIVWEER